MTAWGRQGEIFACDEGARSFNLENPQLARAASRIDQRQD
jgi:hypothetical protein